MSDAGPFDETKAMQAAQAGHHQFVLYIAGTTPQSTRAIVNTRKICETHLKGCYDLEIVDIGKFPQLAVEAQIIATPALLRKYPLPLRRFIGDMSRTADILAGLGLPTTNPEEPSR
jgi:circadian clock protein KaiB